MNLPFSQNADQRNRPLRKPYSSPFTLYTSPLPTVASTAGAFAEGPAISLATGDKSAQPGCIPPALAVHYCKLCDQQAKYRCKSCKKTAYCSVRCQTEDWNAHRHVCKASSPEPATEMVRETAGSLAAGDKSSLAEVKRVSMKDLHFTEIPNGEDMQASVLEFYNPSRFFLLIQSPSLLEVLQCITELQKTYSNSSVIPYVPCVGEVCAVQFSSDMKWYRGLIQTLSADQKMAFVLYIDFGNEENVPVDRIRPLPANIQPFGPCAIECRVAGVAPASGNWSDECCIAVRQMLASKTMTVQLVETQINHVHAVDILLSPGKHLSTFLLEQGFALKETVTKAPTEQDMCDMVDTSLENFSCLSDGKDDNSWAQPPEPLPTAVGDQFSVSVSYFRSPSEFIVQKASNAGIINNLEWKLREHCSQAAATENFRPAPGTVCCAQFSADKEWYRAKILAYSSKERVCVDYIDFGNSEEVDLGHLRPISASLLSIPKQAISCCLAGVRPVGESWSKDCILALQQQLANKILHVGIVGAQGGQALVTMTDEASDPYADIAELLISVGFAISSPVSATSGAQPANEMTTSEKPHLRPQVCEPLVWSSTELPCDGQVVALLASVIESPSKFHCRIDNASDHQKLMELGAQLKQHCEGDAPPFTPKVGEPCCAMFPGDGAWYRAMVNELSEDKATVNFVDYGYSLKVEKGKLRPITPELLTLPFQTVCCWLTGVEPDGSDWSSEALLWFQILLEGQRLFARVLKTTEQGYGVDLESREQNVAAALISEHFAKVSAESSEAKHSESTRIKEEDVKENKQIQLHDKEAPNQTEGTPKKRMSDRPSAVPSEVASFPVDWKTVELPLNASFQPHAAAVSSPSLFYLLGLTQVDQQKLQEVMVELAAYCGGCQGSLSAGGGCRPAPGAACCALFSDNNWYRAVVLEVGENEMSIIYADYGNLEKVPLARILPIPSRLLRLPFQITRCTLVGNEHFPSKWPEEVKQMFQTELTNGVHATVQSFDGAANVLSLAVPSERGGGDLSAMVVSALYAHTQCRPDPDTPHRADGAGTASSKGSTAEPDPSKSKSLPDSQSEPGGVTAITPTSTKTEPASLSFQPTKHMPAAANVDPVSKMDDQMKLPFQNNANDLQISSCCCQSLRKKIDSLEEMMQLQLTLIKQIVGAKK
ncbi:tudor domain-containing protein 1 [Menidia menidia]